MNFVSTEETPIPQRTEEYKVGDVVSLTYGNILMTVNYVKRYSNAISYNCVWHTQDGVAQNAEYTHFALKKHNKA